MHSNNRLRRSRRSAHIFRSNTLAPRGLWLPGLCVQQRRHRSRLVTRLLAWSFPTSQVRRSHGRLLIFLCHFGPPARCSPRTQLVPMRGGPQPPTPPPATKASRSTACMADDQTLRHRRRVRKVPTGACSAESPARVTARPLTIFRAGSAFPKLFFPRAALVAASTGSHAWSDLRPRTKRPLADLHQSLGQHQRELCRHSPFLRLRVARTGPATVRALAVRGTGPGRDFGCPPLMNHSDLAGDLQQLKKPNSPPLLASRAF